MNLQDDFSDPLKTALKDSLFTLDPSSPLPSTDPAEMPPWPSGFPRPRALAAIRPCIITFGLMLRSVLPLVMAMDSFVKVVLTLRVSQ